MAPARLIQIKYALKHAYNLPIEDARAFASLGKSSEFITQGKGPKPIEKLAVNTIVAVIGRKASLSTVSSEKVIF